MTELRGSVPRRRSGHCPRCLYIGNRHLCACIAEIGKALKVDDLAGALRLYEELVDVANAEERERRD